MRLVRNGQLKKGYIWRSKLSGDWSICIHYFCGEEDFYHGYSSWSEALAGLKGLWI